PLDARFPASPLLVDAAPAQALGYGSPSPTTGEQGGLAGMPVAAYDFQGHVGYHCGFQSHATFLSIFWLASDGTDSHLFAATLVTAVGPSPADTPTIGETTPVEIDANEPSVPATAVNVGTPLEQSSFRFVPGSFGETIPTYSAAAGVAPIGSCSSLLADPLACRLDSVDGGFEPNGIGGSVLVVFTKIVAATAGQWDRQAVGILFNQTIEGRAVLSRSFPESDSVDPPRPQTETLTLPNGGGIGVPVPYLVPVGFRTQLLALVPNRSSPVIAPPDYQPDNGTYIYMSAPVTPEAGSAAGIFTRRYRERLPLDFGLPLAFLGANVSPPASANTTDAGFQDPLRIDDALGDSDAVFLTTLHRGREVVVLFQQDEHLWGTITLDGLSYMNENGHPTLSLVDDDFSANSHQGPVGLGVFTHVDPECDTLLSTILVINKEDPDLNPRFYVRVME
ncbi:MAG TPA: hypothetical protein VFF73_22340, partial [Planctomycetota bacterium]|nr:hypothetical protein [Planctomycetota bacterium]